MKDLGVYVHIPFCSSKCYYCDFVSFSCSDANIEGYIDYLIKEIELYKDVLKGYNIKTIFIGGGTPSYLEGQYIVKILEKIYNTFDVSTVEEVTIEANPGTLNKEKLKLYKEHGISRISMGVQSLDDSLLKSIGRIHTCVDFYRNYELIKNLNFKNVNVDLMFGLPNQTVKDCEDTLRKIVKLDIEHISYYSLILEENTLMNKWYKEGKIKLPKDDIERSMYHFGINFLKSQDYIHYEISNFAKKDKQCKHNLVYWELKPYIGFGIAAHSNLNNKRFWNYNNFKGYYNNIHKKRHPVEGEEVIDRKMEMAEYLIMGLRLTKGINRDDFMKRFSVRVEDMYGDVLIKYKQQGLLEMNNKWIRLTLRGLDLANIVYVDLLP